MAFQQTQHASARINSDDLDLDHLLMSVYFLRKYPTYADMEDAFGYCPNTVQKWVWFYLKKLAALKRDKIIWPEAWDDPNSPNLPHFLISVDGTHTRCYERQTDQFNRDSGFYSHKFNKAGYGWEIGLSLWEDKCVSIRGPYPAATHDKTIFREFLMAKLRHLGKRGIADNGYIANDLRDVLTLPNTHDPSEVRELKRRARARHETFNERLKVFKILDHTFRSKGPRKDRKQKICFEAVAVIVQFQMENGQPLFAI